MKDQLNKLVNDNEEPVTSFTCKFCNKINDPKEDIKKNR